ncbi:hypothetical protein DFH08DRAFT_815821 [Mycena albidolilacea]|uniref:Uncharacterized protein n=1 Tax=Mycena albidolilacea TaxID=1033008 RepID=A0AAD6ZLH0_9AGAR|nr:hypothetical protein DFH08DRAFT_815821 [Mycena albidolilacea]
MTKSLSPGRSDVGILQRPKVKRMNVGDVRETENPPRLIRACRARARASLAITPKPELIASKRRNIQHPPPCDALVAPDEEYRAMWLAMLVLVQDNPIEKPEARGRWVERENRGEGGEKSEAGRWKVEGGDKQGRRGDANTPSMYLPRGHLLQVDGTVLAHERLSRQRQKDERAHSPPPPLPQAPTRSGPLLAPSSVDPALDRRQAHCCPGVRGSALQHRDATASGLLVTVVVPAYRVGKGRRKTCVTPGDAGAQIGDNKGAQPQRPFQPWFNFFGVGMGIGPRKFSYGDFLRIGAAQHPSRDLVLVPAAPRILCNSFNPLYLVFSARSTRRRVGTQPDCVTSIKEVAYHWLLGVRFTAVLFSFCLSSYCSLHISTTLELRSIHSINSSRCSSTGPKSQPHDELPETNPIPMCILHPKLTPVTDSQERSYPRARTSCAAQASYESERRGHCLADARGCSPVCGESTGEIWRVHGDFGGLDEPAGDGEVLRSDVPGLASSREAAKPKPQLDKPSQAKSTASGRLGLGLGVAEAQAKGSSRGLEGAK